MKCPKSLPGCAHGSKGAAMSRGLILYGTTDGHTQAIAHAIAQPLSMHGIDTDVIEAGTLNPLPARYDGIIVAASIHAGRYQKAVEQWVRAHQKQFGTRPVVFISVCLAVLQQSDPKVRADLDAIVKRFAATTGWQAPVRSEEHTSELQSPCNLVCRLLLEKINKQ